MRTVARIQIVNDQDVANTFATVYNRLEAWRDQKFRKTRGTWKNRKSGKPAIFTETFETGEAGDLYNFSSEENLPDAVVKMDLSCALFHDQVSLSVDLKTVGASGALLRPNISVSCPRFIFEIVRDVSQWRHSTDADRIFASPFRVDRETYLELEELLLSRHRQLPVVVVSEADEGHQLDSLSNELAKRGCGVAHVVVVNEEASWSLTNALGKDWSCYSGAIRTYLPRAVLSTHPKYHPLWTQSRLLDRVEHSQNKLIHAADLILKPVFELSCYVPRSKTFDALENFAREKHFSKLKDAAAESNDLRALVQLYETEVEELREQVVQLQQQKRVAEENLQAVLSVPAISQSIANDETAAVEIDRSFGTVHDAINAFVEEHPEIKYPDKLDDQVAAIHPQACSPDKIFEYLRGLGRLSMELSQSRALGDTVVNWLKHQGLACSVESETKKNVGLLSFEVDGENIQFENHMKVNDATSPDKCIRIYFRTGTEAPFVTIGCIASKKFLSLG